MTSAPRGNMHEQKDTFQYIPFEIGLKTLLKDPEVSTVAVVYYVDSICTGIGLSASHAVGSLFV